MPHHRTAAILAVGDELALGQKLDTNSRWLSDRLTGSGIAVVEHATVADDPDRLVSTIRRLAAGVDLLIITGGLGPTPDDLTRRALADAIGQDLIEDPTALAQIEAWYASRSIAMPRANRVQALRPAAGACLANEHGTAPGLWAAGGTALQAVSEPIGDILCLPGPPREMMPMFERQAAARFRPDPGRAVHTRLLPSYGLGESSIADRLGGLMDRARNPLIGTTASGGLVTVRIRLDGEPDPACARQRLDADERLIREHLGPAVLCVRDRDDEADALVEVVSGLLRARKQTVGAVESCTGGMLSQMLTALPGSSDIYAGGLVTYSNTLKNTLAGVPTRTVVEHGAVSAPVATAMAEGGLDALGCSHALAITGVAGPGGGTDDKPVGTVWIALATRDQTTDARLMRFMGDRHAIRRWCARTALALLRLRLIGEDMPLVCEVGRG